MDILFPKVLLLLLPIGNAEDVLDAELAEFAAQLEAEMLQLQQEEDEAAEEQDGEEEEDDPVLLAEVAVHVEIAFLKQYVKEQQKLLVDHASNLMQLETARDGLQLVLDEVKTWEMIEVQSKAEYETFKCLWVWYCRQDDGRLIDLKLINLDVDQEKLIKDDIAATLGGVTVL